MPNKAESLDNLTPQQQALAELFKPVALAKTPQEKQMAFLKFIGALKGKKVSDAKTLLDPNSVVRENEISSVTPSFSEALTNTQSPRILKEGQ